MGVIRSRKSGENRERGANWQGKGAVRTKYGTFHGLRKDTSGHCPYTTRGIRYEANIRRSKYYKST